MNPLNVVYTNTYTYLPAHYHPARTTKIDKSFGDELN